MEPAFFDNRCRPAAPRTTEASQSPSDSGKVARSATSPAPVVATKIPATGATNGHNTRTQEHSVMQEMRFTFVVLYIYIYPVLKRQPKVLKLKTVVLGNHKGSH